MIKSLIEKLDVLLIGKTFVHPDVNTNIIDLPGVAAFEAGNYTASQSSNLSRGFQSHEQSVLVQINTSCCGAVIPCLESITSSSLALLNLFF